MLVKTKISVDALEIGMFVVELDRPWTDLPFMLQGLMIKDEFEIRTLRQFCDYVYIDYDYSQQHKDAKQQEQEALKNANQNFSRSTANKAVTGSLRPKTEIENELPRAHHLYQQAKNHLEDLFSCAKRDQKLDLTHTKLVVKECISSIVSNANALFWLTRIQESSDREANHSLRVSVLSIALGHYIGLSSHELEQLGTAALLHDIGKTRIPDDILNKAEHLSDAERRVLQRHTTIGYELLNEDDSLANIIKEVALHHHQRPDGKGYPLQKEQTHLSTYTRIVSIVDAYDDMTHNSPYRIAMSPRMALKELFAEAGKQFDKKLSYSFIKMIGLYPVGSLVKMTNGEVALVVADNEEQKLRPTIELIYDPYGKTRPPQQLNLKQKPLDEYGFPYEIAASLPDGAMGMDMQHYISERLKVHKLQASA
ncbi:HD-GYP domain-containing protein [Kangiella sp. TOML190]|uniref:HD-GYP domain-containing protein n=1 Tax=Kangiella sp. TOML190 TaxID=2931351 RepID=UPI00203ACCEE|nr:HD-GYP domain-containing protein [Kangiella sp. TOML190]